MCVTKKVSILFMLLVKLSVLTKSDDSEITNPLNFNNPRELQDTPQLSIILDGVHVHTQPENGTVPDTQVPIVPQPGMGYVPEPIVDIQLYPVGQYCWYMPFNLTRCRGPLPI